MEFTQTLQPDAPRADSVQSGLTFALRCANRIAACVDRRTPEAAALYLWLVQNGASLGLAEDEIPDEEAPARGKRLQAVTAETWARTIAALAQARDIAPSTACAPVELWLAAFSTALKLDAIERELLSLAIHYGYDRRPELLVDGVCEARGLRLQLNRNAAMLALVLGASAADVELRLAKTGRLLSSGLLRVGQEGEIEVLQQLLSLIGIGELPAPNLQDQLLGAAMVPSLPWDAFAHLGKEAEIAAAVLRAALAGRETGVNILLYGPPGTGKTSFAATLAAYVGVGLRPVTEQDAFGGEPLRQERLAGLQLAQRLVISGETLMLFDEAEDVFLPHHLDDERQGANSRVFMHRLLEQNTVPVIWTANDISALGPAVLRRMTMCLELAIPGVGVRTALWRNMGDSAGVQLTECEAGRLARLVPAAPAVASTALRATRLAGGDAATAELIVEGIARAVAGGRQQAPDPAADTRYDPALVNANRDLLGLAENLLRPDTPRAVSFLLSGPPGSGKSAWVRHLASRVGMEVLQKRASDLLDPFVGGTEQRIAAAFAQARRHGAFLVFDEADSLLGSRAGAVRSWEVSQVNEMLTWMEQHPLPFACTTNLLDRLDDASLRRFLVKLRFDWLTHAQARLAFRRFFGEAPPPGLDALRTLTPADFALVRRRAALSGELGDAPALLGLLVAEAAGRVGGRVTIGFAPSNAA